MKRIASWFVLLLAIAIAMAMLSLSAVASSTSPPDDNPSDTGGPSHGWGGGNGGPGDCGDGIGGKPFDMVNTYTGNLTIVDMPVYYRSIGDAIPFVVYYNCQWPVQCAEQRVPMSSAWSHSYNVQVVYYDGAGALDGAWVFEGNGWRHWFLYNAANGTFTSPKGVFDKLEYYGDGYKLTRADQHKLYFDADGVLTHIEDYQGLTWQLGYTGSGATLRLATITDPALRRTTLDYTIYGTKYYISRVTVPGGLYADFGYTQYLTNYRLSHIADAAGDDYYFDYEGTAGVISRRDPANRQVCYEYANNGSGDMQVVRSWVREYPSGATEYEAKEYQYGVTGQPTGQQYTDVTETKDGANRVTRYIHNNDQNDPMHGTVLAVVEDQGGLNLTQNWAFDGLFRCIRYRDSWTMETDGKAHRHFFYCDDTDTTDPNRLGRMIKYIDPENSDANPTDSGLPTAGCPGFRFTYDTSGNVTQIKTPQDRVTDLYYSSNRVTNIYVRDKNRSGATYDHRTQFTYSASDGYQVASVIDAANHTTTFSYKAITDGWYLQTIHPPVGGDTVLGTNAVGDITSVTDGSGHVTSLQYDNLHRMTQATYPDVGNGQKNVFLDWSCCGLDEITDENGVVTKLLRLHDKTPSVPSPKLWKVIEDYGVGNHSDGVPFLNATTEFGYDEVGNTTSVKDARSLVTDYDYDDADRLSQINYPNGTNESWTYRDDGRVYTHTDARGRTITYRYDADDRLAGSGSYVAINYPNDTDVKIVRGDKDGLVTSMTDGSGTTTASYYNSGWVKDLVVSAGNTKTLAYNYTGVGNVSSLTITPDSRTFSYVYDNANRLSTVTNPDSVVNTLTYDTGSRLSRITRPGSYIEYQYNNRDWVTAVLNRKTDNSKILDISYYYNDGSLWDNTGTPLKFTETYPGTPDQVYTWALRYDWLGRQTQETRTNPSGGTDYAITYDYDLVGNRLHRTQAGATTTFNYAANSNRLDSLTGGESATFTYDNNGDMTGVSGTTYGLRTLVYNDENQLTSITYGSPQVTDTFLYNALGQRYKGVYNGTAIRYLFNGDRVMEELDNSGTVLRRYTTANTSYFAPLLHEWQVSDSASRFPLYNLTGTVRRTVDATGTVRDVYSYDTFGRGGLVSGNPAYPFRFGGAWGYQTDPSGLIQLGARRYWPDLGRFVQEDPIGDGVNWYAYAGADPIGLVDPEGLTAQTNWAFFQGWVSGSLPSDIYYGNGSVEVAEMQVSPGVVALRSDFYAKGATGITGGAYSTKQGYIDTFTGVIPAGSTAVQVGGWAGATVTNNGNGTATFRINNVAGTYSFFGHVVPNRKGKKGSMHNVNQHFIWTEPIKPGPWGPGSRGWKGAPGGKGSGKGRPGNGASGDDDGC